MGYFPCQWSDWSLLNVIFRLAEPTALVSFFIASSQVAIPGHPVRRAMTRPDLVLIGTVFLYSIMNSHSE